MLAPTVSARIEETNEGAGVPNNRTDVTTFGLIAKGAREGEVFLNCWASVLFADDMIDLTSQTRIVVRDETIFAKSIGPRFDPLP